MLMKAEYRDGNKVKVSMYKVEEGMKKGMYNVRTDSKYPSSNLGQKLLKDWRNVASYYYSKKPEAEKKFAELIRKL